MADYMRRILLTQKEKDLMKYHQYLENYFPFLGEVPMKKAKTFKKMFGYEIIIKDPFKK